MIRPRGDSRRPYDQATRSLAQEMLRKIRERIRSDETGFTLIEILVIVLIIGIMVAIALPAFLGRSSKSQDASTRSDVRNMTSQVEACYSDSQDYTKCEPPQNTGLNVGTDAGEVEVKDATRNSYTIVGHSKTGTDFTITKAADGTIDRTCSKPGRGGCPSDGSW